MSPPDPLHAFAPAVPRLRMFAGPNGSGKSSLKAIVEQTQPHILGHYINPDDIERAIRQTNRFAPGDYALAPDEAGWLDYLSSSPFLHSVGLTETVKNLYWQDGALCFDHVALNAYLVSALCDIVRRELLENSVSFSFETVMSAPDKVEFLRQAQTQGYRTYLYFIATRDPDINVSRVANRVALGGHTVPTDKIRARYERSLGFLRGAIAASDRAFLFDNSGTETLWFAEITGGVEIEYKTDHVPRWFQTYVLDKAGT